jgi:glycosyltransferase involved in cell wall biosynthesis
MDEGVRIVRAPVLFRVSKGVIMPTIGFLAWKWARWADVLSLHLPQFDAAGVALRGRLLRKPTVLTYHCDLKLPPGLFNRVVNQVVHGMNYLAGTFSHRIVAYTDDFAENSPYLQHFADKIKVIPPPVNLPDAGESGRAAFGKMHNPEDRRPVIGMATRLASEKGVEVLVQALPKILERFPDARVLFAGQYLDVMGEQEYAQRLAPLLRRYQDRGQWEFLGVLTPLQMAAFYPNLDVLVVPSLNSTESFGLVQVEAMLKGTPCVASDLPGVRQPVKQTGMGRIAAVGSPEDLADAVIDVLAHPEQYVRPAEEVADMFSTKRTVSGYEELFAELREELKR